MSEAIHSRLELNDGGTIPLQGVALDVEVTGSGSKVSVTQRYRNDEKRAVEAIYVFPLEEGAAVCGFEAMVGDRLVMGRVEAKEQAFEIYDDAMADGHGAFLLDQERPNIFTASIGNLKPGDDVQVKLTYVAPLNVEGAALRLMLPTTVSPRYVPATAPEIGQPDGERVNPPRQNQVPYGLTLTVNVTMDGGIKVVESPSHTVRTELDGAHAKVTLSQDKAALDRDFVLLIEPREARRPRALVGREADGTRVIMVELCPAAEDMKAVPKEVIFLLDCSGSMQGDSIEEARRALALSLRALSEGDTFNLVRFGSSYESLWKTPQKFDQKHLDEATKYAQDSYANLGGTEILEPLKAIFGASLEGERSRQVLLLTDGEVSNEDAVIALCQDHRSTSRVFTFGIGAGASEHLVRGVARASRGAAEFIYPGERVEPKVLRMVGRISTPAYRSVSMEWGALSVTQAPTTCPAIFAGDMTRIFARVEGGMATKVVLRADDQRWEVELDLEAASESGPLPALWARQRIRDLEEGEGLRRGSNQARGKEDRTERQLVELGKRYGLLSSATSYVAVEQRSEEEKVSEQAVLRKIPVALTAGWGGHGSVTGRRASAGAGVPLAGMAPPPAAYAMPQGMPAPSPKRARRSAAMDAMPAAAAPSGGGLMAKAKGVISDLFSIKEEGAVMSAPAEKERGFGGFDSFARFDDAKAEADDKPTDRLYDLLLTQKADGSFERSSVLEQVLGAERWREVLTAIGQKGEAVAITEAVLAYLQEKESARSSEWSAAAAKAKRFLGK